MNIEDLIKEANNLNTEELYELADFCNTLAHSLEDLEAHLEED